MLGWFCNVRVRIKVRSLLERDLGPLNTLVHFDLRAQGCNLVLERLQLGGRGLAHGLHLRWHGYQENHVTYCDKQINIFLLRTIDRSINIFLLGSINKSLCCMQYTDRHLSIGFETRSKPFCCVRYTDQHLSAWGSKFLRSEYALQVARHAGEDRYHVAQQSPGA